MTPIVPEWHKVCSFTLLDEFNSELKCINALDELHVCKEPPAKTIRSTRSTPSRQHVSSWF